MQVIKGTIHDEQPDALIFWPTSVDVNKDVKQVYVEDKETGKKYKKWQCDTYRYDKDEYIEELQAQNDIINAQLTDTQVGLAEVYEMIAELG